MAGGHKHKWTWVVKYAPNHFGKRGFKPPLSIEDVCINVGELEELALKLGVCENGTINLESLGYTKLLGAGSLSKPFNIIVRRASRNAIEKVKSIGGSITILSGG
jgi:large subunit ribosomal protein L15